MSKVGDVQVTGSGFMHPSDPRLNLGLPIMSNEQLRASTKALNESLKMGMPKPIINAPQESNLTSQKGKGK